jgi:hypothetical protein
VWALDHEEHLCKLDTQGLSSAVRDIAWDGESKRIAYAGDRTDNQVSEGGSILLQKDLVVSNLCLQRFY